MNCGEIKELLSALVDGEAGGAESRAAERHLKGCAACRRKLAVLRQLKLSVRAVPAPSLPPDLRAALLQEAARGRASRWSTLLEAAERLLAPASLRYGLAAALASAAVVLALRLAGDRGESLPVDALLAAHDDYARTLALAADDAVLAAPPERLKADGGPDEL